MLPTIDISLIGILVAVWNVIKVIWDYTSKAFMWIMHQALALFIGSKFWATAAFVAVGLIIINFLSQVLTYAGQRLMSLFPAVVSIPDSDILKILDLFVSTSDLADLVSTLVSTWAVYRLVISMDFTRRAIQRTFTILSRSWKT